MNQERLPLLRGALDRALMWHAGHALDVAGFLGQVEALAARLPAAPAAVNLCEDRHAFLVAFCALLLRGQTNLLAPSRTPAAIAEVMRQHPGCYALGEVTPAAPPARFVPITLPTAAAPARAIPTIPADLVAMVGYTSGSTGTPRGNPKSWRQLSLSNGHNLALVGGIAGAPFHVVATVPSQHMYGIETTVLMPLLGTAACATERPFFPADIAAALAAVPAPRVLVTTPLHLKNLVASDVELAPLATIISATAPMPVELARAAEARYGTRLTEVFGSTETCVIAHRRSALDDAWTLYPPVTLRPLPDGVEVSAPRLAAPVVLADIVELTSGGRGFRLRGRHADLLEIAGKRASLGDLTQRLNAIAGVDDGVVLQLDPDRSGVRRIAALAVAPGRDAGAILAELASAIDPAFLPRPLKLVAALPRNATGKLPRAALLALLRESG